MYATGQGVPQDAVEAVAVLELAEMRLRGLAPRAVEVLERLLTAESESVALGAANSLADRSRGRATERNQVAAAVTVVKRPW